MCGSAECDMQRLQNGSRTFHNVGLKTWPQLMCCALMSRNQLSLFKGT